MDCFGKYESTNPKCRGCWLRDCCKTTRNEQEKTELKKIKNEGLTIRQFDGKALSDRKIGYNKSLGEFLQISGVDRAEQNPVRIDLH